MDLATLGVGGLDAGVVVVLFLSAFATAVLSAIVGMAGGMTLLVILLVFVPPLVAIPLLAVVQLVSNGSRTWVQRRHVRWDYWWRYALPLLPLGWLSLMIAERIPPDIARGLIGVFVIVATWRPHWLFLGSHPDEIRTDRRFFVLGSVIGVVNVTVGATGPLIAPFFLNLGLSRFAIIGTKAACQMVSHVAKILVFGAVGFAYDGWVGLLLLMSVAAVAGTAVGSRLLARVDEARFVLLYKAILTLIAIFLVLRQALEAAVSG